ncbi:hypothetical protein OIV83_001921 [Microbotryomycetes sp. JL201]|nr:hypothetical protein OIV83_001921 [Microbotryomycetes sp. JL201]
MPATTGNRKRTLSMSDTVYLDPWPPTCQAQDLLVTEQNANAVPAQASAAGEPSIEPVAAAQPNSSSSCLSQSSRFATPKKPSTDSSQMSSGTEAEHARTRSLLRGKILVSDAPTILGQLGVEQSAWDQHVETARDRLQNEEHARDVLTRCQTGFRAERQQMGHGQTGYHWFEELASLGVASDTTTTHVKTASKDISLHVFSTPTRSLRIASDDPLQNGRKPDASIIYKHPGNVASDRDSFEPTLSHIIVSLEFTDTPARISTKRKVSLSTLPRKLQQLASMLIAVMATQPFRTHVPGLAICKDTATLMLLSREAFFVASLAHCWSNKAAELAALATTLLNLETWQIGLFPLFRYSLTPQHGLSPSHLRTDALPQHVLDFYAMRAFEDIRVLRQVSPHHSPFSRGTLVVGFERQTLATLILKRQAVALDRRQRESKIWEAIDASAGKLARNTLGKLSRVLATVEVAPTRKLALLPDDAMVARQYTIVLYRNPSTPRAAQALLPRPVSDHPGPTPTQLLCLIKQAFDVLSDLYWSAGVLHCDISTNNVLHCDGSLVLADWDCAIVANDSAPVGSRSERTGTMDTMAINVLDAVQHLRAYEEDYGKAEAETRVGFAHCLRHDFESLAYVLLKVIWANLEPSADNVERKLTWNQHMFNNANVSMDSLILCRRSLWYKNGAGGRSEQCLRRLSPAFADVVRSLFAQPFDSFTEFGPNEALDRVTAEHVNRVFANIAWEGIETEALMARWGARRR